ncbi:Cys-tRNA(Pro) deacylase [Pseudoalteromonas sp. SSDWG2]|uniref:Cys-tRNA(Pro) deacylase n=1 Tax=Pseudoalteromonas sp. SSDWG2 TaxID=3139391 RepID=UPI003BA96E4A
MTPAVNFLKKNKVHFELLSFEHNPHTDNYGLEVVQQLNLAIEAVFKTLVLETAEHDFIVAITPVNQQVNMKLIAKAAGTKKAHMAKAADVERITGYVLGGVSPFAQKKRLQVYLHEKAMQQACIYVSGGKRGVEIAITPQDLISALNASTAIF